MWNVKFRGLARSSNLPAKPAILAGRATIGDLRRRMHYLADGPTRVLRRAGKAQPGEEEPCIGKWPTRWPLTVLDVCRVAPERHIECVRQWADAVSSTLGGNT